MTTWVAEETFVFGDARGTRWSGRIAIGAPRVLDDHATCDVVVEAVARRTFTIAGDSSLQALLLAVRFAGRLLHGFREAGGRVLEREGGEEVPLDAYFGPLLCAPEAAQVALGQAILDGEE